MSEIYIANPSGEEEKKEDPQDVDVKLENALIFEFEGSPPSIPPLSPEIDPLALTEPDRKRKRIERKLRAIPVPRTVVGSSPLIPEPSTSSGDGERKSPVPTFRIRSAQPSSPSSQVPQVPKAVPFKRIRTAPEQYREPTNYTPLQPPAMPYGRPMPRPLPYYPPQPTFYPLPRSYDPAKDPIAIHAAVWQNLGAKLAENCALLRQHVPTYPTPHLSIEMEGLRNSIYNFEFTSLTFHRRLSITTAADYGDFANKKFTSDEILRGAYEAIGMIMLEMDRRRALCRHCRHSLT